MTRALALGALAVLVSAAPALACEKISSATVKLSACIDDTDWVAQTATPPQDFFYFTGDETIGFQMISEDGAYPAVGLRSAIIANAVAASGGVEDSVKVVGERIENIGGKPWNMIEYQFLSEGVQYLFQNFYYSAPGFGTTQMLFFSDSAVATSAAYRAGQLLSTVSFDE